MDKVTLAQTRFTLLAALMEGPLDFKDMYTAVLRTHPQNTPSRKRVVNAQQSLKTAGLIERRAHRATNDLWAITQLGRAEYSNAPVASAVKLSSTTTVAPKEPVPTNGFDLVITHNPTGETYTFTTDQGTFVFTPRTVKHVVAKTSGR